MREANFLKQAEQNTVDFFYAYCHDNNMEKSSPTFPRKAASSAGARTSFILILMP